MSKKSKKLGGSDYLNIIAIVAYLAVTIVAIIFTIGILSGASEIRKDTAAIKTKAVNETFERYSEEVITVPICTEISLKLGTVILSSCVALPTGTTDQNKPKYETIVHSETRFCQDQIFVLTEDTTVYLTDGGSYTTFYDKRFNDYLKHLEASRSKEDYYTVTFQN